jgi:hypothetical protein
VPAPAPGVSRDSFSAFAQQSQGSHNSTNTGGGDPALMTMTLSFMERMMARLEENDRLRAQEAREAEQRRELAQQQRERESQQHMQTLLRAVLGSTSSATTSTVKAPPPAFLEALDTIKQHAYFQGCDWDMMDPSKMDQSIHIRMELLEKLPQEYKNLFINDARYKSDGFAMLKELIKVLTPAGITSQLHSMAEFTNFSRNPQESESAFFARARALETAIHGTLPPGMMSIKVLTSVEASYPGLVDRYLRNDPVVINATLSQLQDLIMQEEKKKASLFASRAGDDSPYTMPIKQQNHTATLLLLLLLLLLLHLPRLQKRPNRWITSLARGIGSN